jgi:hypothetical protein
MKSIGYLIGALFLNFSTSSEAQTKKPPRTTPSAEVAEPIPPQLIQSSPKPLSGLHLDLTIGSANFQDLQAPMAESGDMRVDGTNVAAESSRHTGLSLSAAVGLEDTQPLGSYHINMGVLRSNSSAPVGGPSASYIRYRAVGGLKWTVLSDSKLITESELRRSSFRNTDNGHYLDAVVLRLGFEQNLGDFTLLGTGAVAPISRFGFTQESGRGKSGALSGTTSSFRELLGRLSYKAAQHASFFLSFSQEQILAEITDVAAYQNFGLNTGRSESNSSRSVDLTTNVIELGASRRF